MLGTCKSLQKSAVWLLLFFILYKMKKLEWLQNDLKKEYIIDKWFIENHHKRQFDQLKTMFWDDWYLKKDGTEYCLIVWNCEMSFISMKWDFAWIVDWIEFGLLCGKHIDKWF